MRWIQLWLTVSLVACAACEQTDANNATKVRVDELMARSRQLEQSFRSMQRALGQARPTPCSDSAIRAAVERSQNRTVPFIDEKSLARTARGKTLDAGVPLANFVSEVLVKRRPSGAVTDEKTATDAAFDAMTLQKEHDFLAVLRFELTPPRADGKGFHAGELRGRLALFELAGGALVCETEVFAESTEEVIGKPGQSPQQAADKDFELQLRRALQDAFRGMTRELNLDLR